MDPKPTVEHAPMCSCSRDESSVPMLKLRFLFDTSYSMVGVDFEPWNRFEEAGETKTTFGYSSAADRAGAAKP